jgi:hypothetical protein
MKAPCHHAWQFVSAPCINLFLCADFRPELDIMGHYSKPKRQNFAAVMGGHMASMYIFRTLLIYRIHLNYSFLYFKLKLRENY